MLCRLLPLSVVRMIGPHKQSLVGKMLMLYSSLRLVAAALALSGLLVATAVPAHAQLQLQAKAKSEGAFVLYVGGADRALGGEGENL
jgi:hypothetical protein